MLAASAQTGFVLFMSALLAIFAFKLFGGQINMRGLLADKETGTFSPGRLQLLIATLGGALFYFFKIVGGSNAGYLGGKIYSKFSKKSERA